MPAPATTPDLLDLVRRSGLVADQLLDNFLRQHKNKLDAKPGEMTEALVGEGLLTCFQAEQLLLGKCRGFSIGKYKILERLGTGGMALVYLCEDPENQMRVAVKVLPNTRAQDMEYLKRFYREARVAAGLDHPNIVRTYDIDHDGKVNFMVMEYVEGTLLHDIVQDHGPMDVLRAAHYMKQVAEGLEHAHEKGLIHRDIKPGNLILNREGTAKILDMGLARNFADESEEVLTRGVLGTPDYLAPEQGKDSHNVDIRADIYSLGCSFYYLLTGAAPFGEGTIAQKLVWHQTKPPKPIRLFRPEVPEGLAAVIHKMLAKDPNERHQTPQEIAADLVPFTQQPIAPPPEAEMPQLSLAARGTDDTEADMARVTPPVNSVAASPPPRALATTPAPTKPAPAPRAAAAPPKAAPPPPPALQRTPAAKPRPTTRGTPAAPPPPPARAAAPPPRPAEASPPPSGKRRTSKVAIPRPTQADAPSEPVPFASEERPWLKWVLVALVMLLGLGVLVVVLGWEQIRPMLGR